MLVCVAMDQRVVARAQEAPRTPAVGVVCREGRLLVCAAMAFNFPRAGGALASAFHAKATTGTIRGQLINIPGRLARSARQPVLHLPIDWPWKTAWLQMATSARAGPLAA